MAVNVICKNPQQLLNGIQAAVQNGSVQKWQVDSDGDFTYIPEPWNKKAWFRPEVSVGKLVFHILGQKTQRMSTSVYAVYHGRLIEMLLTHFDRSFSRASATALPTIGDAVGAEPDE